MTVVVDAGIGHRLREIRTWRGLSLRQAAGLAGFSAAYLSQIERGLKPVDKRSTLEALAAALQVAPSELAGVSMAGQLVDPVVAAARDTLPDLEAALSDVGFGDAGIAPREWSAIQADLALLNHVHRPRADYAAQGRMLPGLIYELQALAESPSTADRTDVLVGLMDAYHSAVVITRNLGVRGLPALAAWHAHRVAEELDDPAWLGLAAWLRSSSPGGGRARSLAVAEAGMVALEPHLADVRCRQMYGALHLNAALACTTGGDTSAAADHVTEAARVAEELGPPSDPGSHGHGHLYFGPDNVGVWRVSLAVEGGEAGQVRELARGVVPERIPSAARQAAFWADLGLGLAQGRNTRAEAVEALLRAEAIAPVWVRTRPLVREGVTDLLRHVRHDTGRRLRGMAYRMGLSA